MSQPVHVAVRDALVWTAIVMTPEVLQMFRDLGWESVLWPGSQLFDVTGMSPQPGIGWTYADGVFSPPYREPDPEPKPVDPAPDPEG